MADSDPSERDPIPTRPSTDPTDPTRPSTDPTRPSADDPEKVHPFTAANLRLEYLDPHKLVPNPLNWRTHPDIQREAIRGSIARVGWAGAILMNQTTGHIIDGHERVEDALEQNTAKVPVLIGEWTEDQEKFILATLDPLTALAEVDVERLGELLPQIQADNAALKTVLDELSATAATTDAAFAFHRRGTVERSSYITLLISVTQHRVIEAAIEHISRKYLCSRGDAFEKVCQLYCDTNKAEMEQANISPDEVAGEDGAPSPIVTAELAPEDVQKQVEEALG